jgi:hypothetical protein
MNVSLIPLFLIPKAHPLVTVDANEPARWQGLELRQVILGTFLVLQWCGHIDVLDEFVGPGPVQDVVCGRVKNR